MYTLKRLWAGFLDLILPVRCLFCHKIVETYRWVLPICQEDYNKLPRIEGPVCQICGLPLGRELFYLSYDITKDPAPACGTCRRRFNFIEFTLAPFAYRGRMQKIIHSWKFGVNKNWGDFLGELLAGNLPGSLPEENWDYLVPIPLTVVRREQRGFNQARQLANKLSKKYNLPVKMALRKEQQTTAQSLLQRKQRLENPVNSFGLCFEQQIKNKNLIVVDDIYTTGATVREACRTLLEAGARKTAVIVLARSLPVEAGYGQTNPEENWLPV